MIVVAYGLILPALGAGDPAPWAAGTCTPRCCRAGAARRRSSARSKPATTHTGVCLMQMEKGLDTGPVLLSLETPIGAEDTGGSLHDRLAALGAEVLADGLKLLRAGMRPLAQPQPDDGVDLRAQAGQGRGAARLVAAAPRCWTRQRARLPSLAGRRGDGGRRAPAHPRRARRCRSSTGSRRARCWRPAAPAWTSPAARARCACCRCSAKAAARSRSPTTSTPARSPGCSRERRARRRRCARRRRAAWSPCWPRAAR